MFWLLLLSTLLQTSAAAQGANSCQKLDILFIFDISGSVGSLYSGNYKNFADNFASLFTLSGATDGDNSNIGLLTFNTNVYVNLALGQHSLQSFQAAVNAVPSGNGGTDIKAALLEAQHQFNISGNPNHGKMLVFMTDGSPSEGTLSDCVNVGTQMTNAHIDIFFIGDDGYDTNTVQQLSKINGNANWLYGTPSAAQSAMPAIALQQFPCKSNGCGRAAPWFTCMNPALPPEGSIYYIDNTPYLSASQVAQEFQYIKKNLVGNIGTLNPNVTFYPEHYAPYGAGGLINTPLAQNSSISACDQLDQLLATYQSSTSKPVSLVQVLQSYTQDPFSALIFIFSGSTNDTDIDMAASFILNNIQNPFITLIALEGASTRFETHGNAWKVYRIPHMSNPPPGVAYCIAKRTCLDTTSCETASYTSTSPPRTTFPAMSTVYQTTRMQTTLQPTTQPAPSAPQHGCTKCDLGKVWVDLMYVIDSSEATGATNLAEIWGLVQTISPWFNVQKTTYTASNYSMRVGIVSYGSQATLVAPLGSLVEDDIDFMNMPLRTGDHGTNLASALLIASSQLNSSAHRPNAKQVILVLATTYRAGQYELPANAASSFTDKGGIIIVYEDVKDTASHSATLQQIASPGYFISSLNSNTTTVQQAICDANCFCADTFQPFTTNLRGNPTAGCFKASTVPGNLNVAKRNCLTRFNNGFVANDVSVAQTYFLQDLFGTPTNFYIGLVFDSFSQQWVWSDGTPLSGSYQPWLNGVRPTSSAMGGCVYIAQGTGTWIQTDCRNGYLYACESNPCDSTHYCPLQQQ